MAFNIISKVSVAILIHLAPYVTWYWFTSAFQCPLTHSLSCLLPDVDNLFSGLVYWVFYMTPGHGMHLFPLIWQIFFYGILRIFSVALPCISPPSVSLIHRLSLFNNVRNFAHFLFMSVLDLWFSLTVWSNFITLSSNYDILFPPDSFCWWDFALSFLLDLLNNLISSFFFHLGSLQPFYVFIEFYFHSLTCFPYITQLFVFSRSSLWHLFISCLNFLNIVLMVILNLFSCMSFGFFFRYTTVGVHY